MSSINEYEFYVESSNIQKVLFTQIRNSLHLTVAETIDICNISESVYDRIISNKRISKANALKICFGLKLNFLLAMKFLDATGNHLNALMYEDYQLINVLKKL